MDFKNALGIDFNDAKTGAALEDIEEYEMLISQLVKVRRERKLTQQQVADALETTQPVISELERLAGNPSISRLMEYARAVGQRLYLYTSEVTNVAVARDLDYIAKPDIYTLEIDAVTKQSENDQQRNRPASDAYSPSTSYAATV